jgi:integrase/recombinase XerD
VSAIDRYVRARRGHRLAHSPALWLGDRGKGFSYWGLDYALRRRADQAGVPGFHLHRMRNTASHRWLVKGGPEQSLMAIAAGPDRT